MSQPIGITSRLILSPFHHIISHHYSLLTAHYSLLTTHYSLWASEGFTERNDASLASHQIVLHHITSHHIALHYIMEWLDGKLLKWCLVGKVELTFSFSASSSSLTNNQFFQPNWDSERKREIYRLKPILVDSSIMYKQQQALRLRNGSSLFIIVWLVCVLFTC